MNCLRLPWSRCAPASLTLMFLAAAPGLATAAEAVVDNTQLQQQIDALNARLKELEKAPPATPVAVPAHGGGISGLSFGAYGEMKFGAQQNAADNGRWQNGFDGARLTLLPSYQINDVLLFKAEIEFEHGGLAFDADDKLGGAIEVEQAYIDLTVNEYLHWRMPGIDLIPFGYTNLMHEPTLFYSVNRPELAEGLIPTTWFAGATSLHGNVVGSLSYQFQVSTSIIDNGGHVNDTTEANGPAALGYEAGISGTEALGLSRAPVGDFKQQNNQLGYALRLAYAVPGASGLLGSTSVYFSPDIEPRGAYASDANNVKIGELGSCALTMVDSEMRYRPQSDGLELRAEAVGVAFSNPGNMRANNDGDAENNVGSTMWGISGEIAWHCHCPGAHGWELVPFYRYTGESRQNEGFDGADGNQPTGAGRLNYHTLGLAVFPAPSVVLKVDYQAVRDGSADGPQSDHVLGGVGFFF